METAQSPPKDVQTGGRHFLRRKNSRSRELIEWFAIIVVAVAAAMLIKAYLIQAFYIPSESMQDTLQVNDRVFVNKLSYKLHGVHRGDVVVFRRPAGLQGGLETEDLIKRVIALPGDSVEGRDGIVFVNDKATSEPYTKGGHTTGDFEKHIIGPRQVWVMGDNRGNSTDSRIFGPVPQSRILGRAFVVWWPVSALKLL